MKRIIHFILIALFLIPCCAVQASHQPEFSTAGFFQLPNSGREVFSMNPAWRFYKGAVAGAEAANFNDAEWTVVSLPNGIEYLPTEASGCINYQGEVWYRKHFTPADALKGKKLFLHFEAIMGKSKVFVNGKLLTEHFGGYLPVVVDISDVLNWGEDNVIAVWADNSDDTSYPPGKAQDVLDFTYFGGIYRDCWLVAHNPVFITDPNFEDEVAGGGLFVAYDKVSDTSAEVLLKAHLRNDSRKTFAGIVEYELQQPDGTQVAFLNDKVQVRPGKAVTSQDKITIKNPLLWSPETPTLYNLIVRIRDREGNVIVTRLNEGMCQEIAKDGKGIYVRVDNSNSAQKAISQEISKMAKSDVESKIYTDFNEQFQAIAWIILLLLLAEMLILDRKNPLFKNVHLFSNKK